LNAAALAPGRSDRRVGVRHQLGDDLREVDPGLGEVLAKVAPADAAVAQLRGVDCHAKRISASVDSGRPAPRLQCSCIGRAVDVAECAVPVRQRAQVQALLSRG
jgi:hypothetical protein